MNVNKLGTILALIASILTMILSIFSIMIGYIIDDLLQDPAISAVVNSALPLLFIYLVLSIIALAIACISFVDSKQRVFAILNISIHAVLVIYTIIISILNMPDIILIGEDIPIIAFATIFTVILIASILGTIGGCLKLKEA